MTLASSLNYAPQPLRFGTSGRRGEVIDLTQLEIYINALGELEYLQTLTRAEGGIAAGEEFFFGHDLRPSSVAFSAEALGRGEICQAIVRAIDEAGMKPVNCGAIPTPAVMAYAVARGRASIMVTGSHIPFDRNGYKLNTSLGELLKVHEIPIQKSVERVRERIYGQAAESSAFALNGMFRDGHRDLPEATGAALAAYKDRYVGFFGAGALAGKRLAVYQHSAVGRDFLVDLLLTLGAEVFPCGRSEEFVPIDTENIDAAQLAVIQQLAAETTRANGPIDAVVSTDGDSDRPLILSVDRTSGKVRFHGGDLVGMIVAEFLRADAVVVPVTCNDAIDRGPLAPVLEPKTKIGSPFVIVGMEEALAKGRRAVCGWEANGGFLTGSDIELGGRVLRALPTRDAMLPILAALAASGNGRVASLFDALPKRFSRAALLKNYPREQSLQAVARFSGPGAESRKELEKVFSGAGGFGAISKVDCTDGVRVYFANGDVAHFRPSGNADEFRIYAVSDTQERADEIVAMGVQEPDGLLRRLGAAGSSNGAPIEVQRA